MFTYVYVHPNSSNQQYRSLNHGCSRHHLLGAKVPEQLWLQMASESDGSFVDRLYHVIPVIDRLYPICSKVLVFHVNLSTADVQTLGIRRLTGYHLPVRAPSGLALAVSFALTHVDMQSEAQRAQRCVCLFQGLEHGNDPRDSPLASKVRLLRLSLCESTASLPGTFTYFVHLCTASFAFTLQNSGNFLQTNYSLASSHGLGILFHRSGLEAQPHDTCGWLAKVILQAHFWEFFRLPGQNITMFAVKGNLGPPSKSRSASSKESKESKDQVMGEKQCPWPNRHTHVWSYSVLNVALGENCKLMEQYPPEMAKILWSSGSEARETSCNEVAGVFLRMG